MIVTAELAKAGTWPLAGGWLDQTVSVVEGVRLVWAFDQECELALREAQSHGR